MSRVPGQAYHPLHP